MGFFDRFKQSNINQGIEEYKRTDDAVLLDVRTPQVMQMCIRDRLSVPCSLVTDTSYLPSVSTSAISFAVALTIRMPLSLIPSRSRCV